MSGAVPGAARGMPGPGMPGPGMDVAAFAAQMRAQAVARHDYHVSSGHHKRCGVIAIALHLSVAVLVTAIIWATYYSLRKSTQHEAWYTGYDSAYYPWPFFVNWVITVTVLGSVGFTLATVVPLISSCRVGPRWNTIVLGNLVVVNVMLWLVYAITACRSYPYHEGMCDFPWPIFVTLGTICAALVTTTIACTTGYASGPPPGPLVVNARVVGDLEGGHAAK